MKIFKYILCYILVNSLLLATFSIVAVDKTTGEVGSAGGSCIAGSIIISDIHPGVGAIHTQAYYLQANQNYASTLMDQGYSPSDIIQFLEENDVQNNPSIRQYGIVDLYSGNNYGMLYEYECNEVEGAIWYGNPNIHFILDPNPNPDTVKTTVYYTLDSSLEPTHAFTTSMEDNTIISIVFSIFDFC